MSELYKLNKGKICNGVNKEIIKNNFSKYAEYYDRYSDIQNLCASELILRFDGNIFKDILDIGCGTGNYTKLLKERFPRARLVALDISGEMIKIAKGKLPDKAIEFVVKDAETIDFNEKFDLITSNASFQWFENLPGSLAIYNKLINKNGVIAFSLFGPMTFYELEESLKELHQKVALISSCNFFEKKPIEKFLKDIFNNVTVDEKIYKEKHASLPQLLKKIKYTGTNGDGINKKSFWTPRLLNRLEEIYKKRYGNIVATYQVFFCEGRK